MQDKWGQVGHSLGECWYNSDFDISYINIPKNASTFVKSRFLGYYPIHAWKTINTLKNCKDTLVVLRDPIDRWCSGIAQFIVNHPDIDLSDHEIFNTITFDDHTELQKYFLQEVNLNNCTFIFLDQNFNLKFDKWYSGHGFRPKQYNDSYSNVSEGKQLELKLHYTNLVNNYPDYLLKLKEHFADDYKLIESVKFYD